MSVSHFELKKRSDMKGITCILLGAAVLLSAAEKLPVDEDVFLNGQFDFSCERHREKEAELLKPPAKNYAFPQNKIVWKDTQPVITSDGRPLSLFAGQLMSATNGNPLSARELRQAGVNLFLVDVNYVHSKNIYSVKSPRSADPGMTFRRFAQNASALLKSVPDAKIIIRIWASYEGDDYRQLYPDALLTDPSGNTVWKNGDRHANYLTEWKLYLAERVRGFLEKVGESRFAPHIAGVYIGAMNTGEWWYWKDGSFYWDYSKTRQEAFRNFLQHKYGSEGLKELGKRYAAQDETDLFRLPARKERSGRVLPCSRVADYYQVLNLPVTNAAKYLAQVIKAVSGGRLLAGMEILTDLNTMNVNGTVFVNQLLNCPELDFLGAPSPYPLRYAGGFSPHRAVDGSLRLRGKMFFAEDDFRTHAAYGTLAGQGCPAPTPMQSAENLRRQGMSAILRGHTSYLMEFGGRWFTHPAILKEIARLNRLRSVIGKFDAPRRAEIALVSDQESQLYSNYFANPTELREKVIPFLGADHDFYEMQDILRPEVFKQYKLIVFLNIAALGERERQGIEKMKSDGRSLVFLYNPGSVNLTFDRTADLEDARNLTSFQLKKRPRKIEWGKVALRADMKNMKQMLDLSDSELNLGSCRKLEPAALSVVDPGSLSAGVDLSSWAVDDPEAVPLAYSSEGSVRFAVRRNSGWTSYYSASTSLPAGILRAIARKAGCHIVSPQGNVIFTRGGFTSVHTAFKGEHVISLPGSGRVLDCISGRELELNGENLVFTADQGETRLFYRGEETGAVKTALVEAERKQQTEIAAFCKAHPSPSASSGWVAYSNSHRRPKSSGPFKFTSFSVPAMLCAGPFADFDGTVSAMSSLLEIHRMAKEPVVKLSAKLDSLNRLLKILPAQDPAKPEWAAVYGGNWHFLHMAGIARGQSALYSCLLEAPEDTALRVLFGADARAKLLIGDEEIPTRIGTAVCNVTLKKGLTRVLLAIENTRGDNGFTLKFFHRLTDGQKPEYCPPGAKYNWTQGKIWLETPQK